MARHGFMAAWLAGGATALLLLLPAPARACDHHAAKAPAAAKREAPPKATEAKAADSKVAPAKEAPAMRSGQLLAEKCKCDGPGDCTCAKGKCQCPKCNRSRHRMFESLRGRAEGRVIPVQRDAAAGALI